MRRRLPLAHVGFLVLMVGLGPASASHADPAPAPSSATLERLQAILAELELARTDPKAAAPRQRPAHVVERELDAMLAGIRKAECPKLGAELAADASPEDAFEHVALFELAGCGDLKTPTTAWLYHLDRTSTPPSALVHFALARRCVSYRVSTQNGLRYPAYLVCGPELERLDIAALASALREASTALAAKGVDPSVPRYLAYEQGRQVAVAAKEARKKLDAEIRADPDLRTVFFEAPHQGQAAWRAADDLPAEVARVERAVWAAYLRTFTAPPRSVLTSPPPAESLNGLAGCDAPLRAAIEQRVGQLGAAATREAVERELGSPAGQRLLSALSACELVGGEDLVARDLVTLVRAPLARGPRMAGMTRAFEVAGELAKHGKKLPWFRAEEFFVSEPYLYVLASRALGKDVELPTTSRSMLRVEGKVGKLGEKDGWTRIEFARMTELVSDVACKPTGPVLGYRWVAGGAEAVYDEVCRDLPPRRVDVTPEPVRVPSRYARGLRPGAYVTLAVVETTREGFVRAAYDSPAKRRLVLAKGFRMASAGAGDSR